MRIAALRIIHLAKGPGQDLSFVAFLKERLPQAFHLDSCQRLLWACWDEDYAGLELPGIPGLEVYEGADAYCFFLRVATGLESQILGETDIFGQLKDAWRKNSSGAINAFPGVKGFDDEMSALIQRLFEDTKDIRSRYLQNLGGASYGSLVRMMLKQSPGPRLIVGAGQLAQSVAPYLLDEELWILNRSLESIGTLIASLNLATRAPVAGDVAAGGANAVARADSAGKVSGAKSLSAAGPILRVISPENEAMAWRQAASVVVCIPFDAAKDIARASWRAERGKENEGPVIHLGGPRESSGAWRDLGGFEALDDLFALKKVQGDVRMTQVRQAGRACDEKAKLRSLGASVTLPHGWEDLALFA